MRSFSPQVLGCKYVAQALLPTLRLDTASLRRAPLDSTASSPCLLVSEGAYLYRFRRSVGGPCGRGVNMRPRLRWLVIVVAAVVPAFGGPIFTLPSPASSFGLLGGSVSNTGTSVVIGNVGATSTVTGFNPTGTATGFVCTPTSAAPCTSGQDSEVTSAYNQIFNAGGAFSTGLGLSSTQSLAGLTTNTMFLGNNVYRATSTVSSTTGINLTFDAQGDPTEVFVIQIDGDLTVNGAMTFILSGGAQPSNIFWIVQDAATISVASSGPIVFDGDILAGTSFTMSAAAGGSGVLAGTINGCVFAQTANTLAGTTNVNGCSASVPEPGTAGLLSLGGLLGILAWRKLRF